MEMKEAVEILINGNSKTKKTLNFLMLWDKEKTFTENIIFIGYKKSHARNLKKYYKLKCASKTDLYKKNWDPNLTIIENARNLKISKNNAYRFAVNHKMDFKSGYKKTESPEERK